MTENADAFEADIADGPYRPTFESLRDFECPDWFRDAKFGIWSHWGPQAVPMYGDWYARNMYIEGSDQYRFHIRRYGHPSVTGYRDIVRQWRAERFDPAGLTEMFVAAGAKYLFGQAVHHDNLFLYDSAIHPWNSVRVGPGKDIVQLWKSAAAEHGLPFGLSEHLGATFSWWGVNKGADRTGPYAGQPYDGNDPESADLYLDNAEHYVAGRPKVDPWYTTNPAWHRHWFSCIKEVVDRYRPDLLYSDGAPPFGPGQYEPGLAIAAHLYNTSAAVNGGVNRAIYTQKDRDPQVYRIGVLDIERSQAQEIRPEPWQTDTSVGDWYYNVRDTYKTPGHVIEMLIDIVAKNGNLLLNVPQRPDGALDDECVHLLRELAVWTSVAGEGIYGTRPHTVAGEGPSRVVVDGFTENQVAWTGDDFRFTRRGDTLYAFQMRWPEDGLAIIRSLPPDRAVAGVRLLGGGEVSFQAGLGALVVRLPERRPEHIFAGHPHCLAVDLTPEP